MKKKLILWLMQTRAYKYFMENIVWRLRFSNYYVSFTGKQYHEGYSLLKPGHTILVNDPNKVTSFLIPGLMDHAAYCRSKGVKYAPVPKLLSPNVDVTHPYEIGELTHKGYTQSYFFDLCKEAERVMILNCTKFDQQYIEAMNQYLEDILSVCIINYDNHFEMADITPAYISKLKQTGQKIYLDIYCSEISYLLDFERRWGASLADLAGLGRPYISPDGLAKANNAICIYDSAGQLTGLTGPQIRQVLK